TPAVVSSVTHTLANRAGAGQTVAVTVACPTVVRSRRAEKLAVGCGRRRLGRHTPRPEGDRKKGSYGEDALLQAHVLPKRCSNVRPFFPFFRVISQHESS